ncbi:ATPase AAA-type core, partial [Penicillium coprophilum]|uniref:ATPase AAA-type core n=1 Tax=Penicillium coprophilum TaxID=36646 RepID=UPI0023A3DB61
WTPDFVFIKFYIRYNNGLKGYAYRCPLIYRKASSELYLLKLYYKIGHAISLPWQNEDDEDTDKDPLEEQERFEKSSEDFWFSLKKQQDIKLIRYTPSQNKLYLFLY